MGGVVVIDGARYLEGSGECLPMYNRGLDIQCENASRVQAYTPWREIETFVSFINGSERHSADGAFPWLVGLDPRMHAALVEQDLAFCPMRTRVARGCGLSGRGLTRGLSRCEEAGGTAKSGNRHDG